MRHIEMKDARLKRIVSDEPPRKRAGGFQFIEGPVWQGDDGIVIFSDIPADRMYFFDPKNERIGTYREPSNKANGNIFDHEHRLITCEHSTSRMVRQEADGSLTIIASHYEGIELNSPNDVIIDGNGRLYFTDPPYGRLAGVGIERQQSQKVQGVYRVDPRDRSIVRLADDFDRPNGLCFAGNETVLYVNDSARMHIRRYEIHGQDLAGGEVWAQVKGDGPGAPDGMKIDSEGNLFCCGPGGVHVFSGGGELLGVILVPEQCANFNWGDADRRTLYLCASTSLFSCRVQVSGFPAW